MINKRLGKSKKFAQLKHDRSRIIYVLMYINADCEGRFLGDPEDVKIECCPYLRYSPRMIEESILDLHEVELLDLYDIDGIPYIQFRNFEENQVGMRKEREADSEIPEMISDSIRTRSGGLRTRSALSLKIKRSLKEVKVKSNVPIEEVDIALTNLLIGMMEHNLPNSHIVKNFKESESTRNDWMNQCRIMREKDKRSPEDIEFLIRWSQEDEFWKGNILSMSKLRKQFDRLLLQSMRGSIDPGKQVGISKKKKSQEEVERSNKIEKKRIEVMEKYKDEVERSINEEDEEEYEKIQEKIRKEVAEYSRELDKGKK